ncbi:MULTISPECIES: hypothetical protein [Clostridium]|jgi:hypothetical protein|uniref:hypothetical protein n=1 Tax=Clostridium TaxID=1485 RepID=UPI00242E77C8|nr:hypothetical protein [Clostridium tyrobutyricum]
MYTALKITKNGKGFNSYDEEVKEREKVKEILQKSGYEVEAYCTVSYAFIKQEVEYRSENWQFFGFERELTKEEITEITEEIYDIDQLYSDAMDMIDDEINKIIETNTKPAKEEDLKSNKVFILV